MEKKDNIGKKLRKVITQTVSAAVPEVRLALTKFSGVEREREGNCHFAGEHTSIDFQGYLNEAAESGERAANEIISGLRYSVREISRSAKILQPLENEDKFVNH